MSYLTFLIRLKSLISNTEAISVFKIVLKASTQIIGTIANIWHYSQLGETTDNDVSAKYHFLFCLCFCLN